MITPDGQYLPHDEFVKLVKDAEIVEIICPYCGYMTRTEWLIDGDWYCYECKRVFKQEGV